MSRVRSSNAWIQFEFGPAVSVLIDLWFTNCAHSHRLLWTLNREENFKCSCRMKNHVSIIMHSIHLRFRVLVFPWVMCTLFHSFACLLFAFGSFMHTRNKLSEWHRLVTIDLQFPIKLAFQENKQCEWECTLTCNNVNFSYRQRTFHFGFRFATLKLSQCVGVNRRVWYYLFILAAYYPHLQFYAFTGKKSVRTKFINCDSIK